MPRYILIADPGDLFNIKYWDVSRHNAQKADSTSSIYIYGSLLVNVVTCVSKI